MTTPEKNTWSLEWGRPSQADETPDREPFEFWLEYEGDMSITAPLQVMGKKGGFYCILICDEVVFTLGDDALPPLRAAFFKYSPLIRLYYEIAVSDMSPIWGHAKQDVAALMDFNLSEKEFINVDTYLNRFTKIYLIQDSRSGLVKIGRSHNPYSRLRQLIKQDTLLPQQNEFSLLHSWEDFPDREENLHKVFANCRVRGEWFSLGDSEIQQLMQNFPKNYND